QYPTVPRFVLPAGWTLRVERDTGCGGAATWAYHIAAAGDPSSWTFQAATTASTTAGALVAYGGLDVESPIPDADREGGGGANPYETGSITTTAPRSLVVLGFVTS